MQNNSTHLKAEALGRVLFYMFKRFFKSIRIKRFTKVFRLIKKLPNIVKNYLYTFFGLLCKKD